MASLDWLGLAWLGFAWIGLVWMCQKSKKVHGPWPRPNLKTHAFSSAAFGIAQRSGIGKVRHLRTQGLWVHEVRLTRMLAYHKVLGRKHPSDILTTHVPAELF